MAGALTSYMRHADGYPVALISAPAHGVWAIDEEHAAHYTNRGKIEEQRFPEPLRGVERGVTAVMSPCGTFWFRVSTDDVTST